MEVELLSEQGVDSNLLIDFELEVEKNGKSLRNRINLAEMRSIPLIMPLS